MHSNITRYIFAALIVAAGWLVVSPRVAEASGCRTPPCGALSNETNQTIRVRYKDNNSDPYTEKDVPPHTTVGGFWNDGLDIDDWWIPERCTDTYDWTGDRYTATGPQWRRINLGQTVTLKKRECTAAPPPPPPPGNSCSGPGGYPGYKTYVRIFATAPGHSGPSNNCPQVGASYTASNPQYIWCRRWGQEVRDGQGNYNHWWLWTDLDTGGSGWISAYYIAGQGNDQADDINTGNAIPACR
jgi:hypothetical protein